MNNKKLLFINRPIFRIPAVLVISAVIVLSASNLFSGKGPAEGAPAEQFNEHLRKRIPELMEYYNIPGVSFALVDDARIVWTETFGYADMEKGEKMTEDSMCRVESISKAVTAWGVMKLAEEGRIDLGAPVEGYFTSWEFPETRFSTDTITARRLLSANAGLPLGTIGIRFSPEDRNIPSLTQRLTDYAVPFQEPGSSFYYSNVGYWILELLLEEVTGTDFARYMDTSILDPLGMKDASFSWSEEFDARIPKGYDSRGNPVPPYIYPDQAAGGLFATARDIASFVIAGMNGFPKGRDGKRVLPARSIETIYSPAVDTTGYYGIVFDSYGFGHFIETLPSGNQAVAVGGQGTGWMCHFHSVPESGDGIVILTNSGNSWPFFAHILRDWTGWLGFGRPGMGVINTGQMLIWIFIGLVLAAVIRQSWKVIQDWAGGSRRLAPFAREARGLRIAAAAGFAVLGAGLLWVFTRDYFFLNSTFPIASGWLWGVLSAAEGVLLLSALLPRRR